MAGRWLLVLFSCVSATATSAGQEPIVNSDSGSGTAELRRTVFPITAIKAYGPVFSGWLGTGFCLDTACRFVGTNYHVALVSKPKRIQGETVVRQFLATSEKDEGATRNVLAVGGGELVFNASRDLAIFELRHALRDRRGLGFYTAELEIGRPVAIVGYPKEGLGIARSFCEVRAQFEGETPEGLWAFRYELADGKHVGPGASGGIVVDRQTGRIAGILSAIAMDREGVALAVPIRSLVEFVSKAQPYLAQTLFPPPGEVPEISSDYYPKLAAPNVETVARRAEVPDAVGTLRRNAQSMVDRMDDLVAVQTFVWGSGNHAPMAHAEYEVRYIDGAQRFREYPNGKKELREVPYPAPLGKAVKPIDAWSRMLALIGTELGLKLQQAPDVKVDGKTMKVFRYWGHAESGACRFQRDVDLGFLAASKTYSVGCYGEVWTDEDLNILRLSQHLELSGSWKNYQVVMTYGWLEKAGEARRLVPVSICAQAECHKKVYWCRGRFMDYQIFESHGRVMSERFDKAQLNGATRSLDGHRGSQVIGKPLR